MTRALIAFLFAALASPALAQDYNRQDIVRGLCQPDGCDEFTILAADRLKVTHDGTLLKTRIQGFHASHAGRQERRQEDGYVYCSPTRPAIMAEENGQTIAFFLAPFAPQDSRETVRKNANFHALYLQSAMAGRPARRPSTISPGWLRALATVWRSLNPGSCR